MEFTHGDRIFPKIGTMSFHGIFKAALAQTFKEFLFSALLNSNQNCWEEKKADKPSFIHETLQVGTLGTCYRSGT